MEHWGDPWSDNVNDTSTTNTEVTSPLPATQSSAPVHLSALLDDAGWGNEDASFGEWATSSETTVAESKDCTPTNTFGGHGKTPISTHWGTEEQIATFSPTEEEGWYHDLQNGVNTSTAPADESDSATTVQQDETAEEIEIDPSVHMQLDEVSSARPSTSLSEDSHEPLTESPRTSIDEEHKHSEFTTVGEEVKSHLTSATEENGSEIQFDQDKTELTHLVPQDAANSMIIAKELSDTVKGSECAVTTSPIEHDATIFDIDQDTYTPGQVAFSWDTNLSDGLFAPDQETDTQEEAPDDPIYSTSGRKAWYRLTRKETLRELNSGNADENYIRVTWATSEVRKVVNETIGRWAREDRLSGTGPGARASFYWDTAPTVSIALPRGHSRTKTSVPASRVMAPERQSLPPLSKDTPVAFNWSSVAEAHPWALDTPPTPSRSSPLVENPIVPSADQEQRQEALRVSMEVAAASRSALPKVTSDMDQTIGIPDPVALPEAPPPADFAAQRTGVSSQANILTQNVSADVLVDDDDDWGEMVGSPTSATSEPRHTIPQSAHENAFSNEASLSVPGIPPPSRSLSGQKQSTDASHIMRLQGTISPTSATFGVRNFVPFGVEKGPIGPGILKPMRKSPALTVKPSWARPLSPKPVGFADVQKTHDQAEQQAGFSSNKESASARPMGSTCTLDEDDKFSALSSSPFAPPFVTPETQRSAVALQPEFDAWADADFSFFDTAQLHSIASEATSQASFPSTQQISSRPAMSVTGVSSKTRATSPPPLQPLTGTTNTAHRNIEEERIIRDILDKLPSLDYMLQ